MHTYIKYTCVCYLTFKIFSIKSRPKILPNPSQIGPGRPNCIMVNWMLLTGVDVAVRNAMSVRAKDGEDTEFSIAVICPRVSKTTCVLQTQHTFMPSTKMFSP